MSSRVAFKKESIQENNLAFMMLKGVLKEFLDL
jgi:hypothetical protein